MLQSESIHLVSISDLYVDIIEQISHIETVKFT